MTDTIDPNTIIAQFLSSRFDGIVASLASGMQLTKNAVSKRFHSPYKEYLSRILERHSKAKSFFVRSEPRPIYEFFISPNLSNAHSRLHSPEMTDLANASPASIVTGSGGCGKTMLLRHLLVSCIKSKAKTPVILELRQLNGEDQSLRAALTECLSSNGLTSDEQFIEQALRAGHFCILLDGFDELELEIRKRTAKEIRRLATTYPKNWIVLSSRPDSTLEGWPAFSTFSVDPFNLKKAAELVQKLPPDDSVKQKFIDDLRNGLFEQHRSFLSNPLLLSIMLLTYNDVARIPEKLSIFYNQAYESLFQKHDALKGGFQRERRSPLDIQEFARVFSAFCVHTYDRREFHFSREKALEYLDAAKKMTALEYNSSGVLDDAIQAVCLMLEDGLELAYVHRSFQEYFAARFIRSAPPTAKKRLIERFTRHAGYDAVMQLLFEIDQHAVEEHYLLPAIDDIRRIIQLPEKSKIGITHYMRYIKHAYSEFILHPSKPDPAKPGGLTEGALERGDIELAAGVHDIRLINAVQFAHKNYPLGPRLPRNRTDEIEVKAAAAEAAVNGRIECASLKTTSRFARALFELDDWWGPHHIGRIIDLGKQIRAKHNEAEESLEALLADGRHSASTEQRKKKKSRKK